MTRIVTTLAELRHQVAAARSRGDRVGLVPTRGTLHAGHAALLRTAHAQCDLVACCVLRPEQRRVADATAPGTDPQARADAAIAEDAGADLLWRPPPGPVIADARTRVVPPGGEELAPLALALVQLMAGAAPDVAYVGERHYEHARLLGDVVHDLGLDVEVRVVPTPRDPDGLPRGLAAETLAGPARSAAAAVPRALDAAAADAAAGEGSLFRLRARVEGLLADAGPGLVVRDVATVHPASFRAVDRLDEPALLVIEADVDGIPISDSRLLVPG